MAPGTELPGERRSHHGLRRWPSARSRGPRLDLGTAVRVHARCGMVLAGILSARPGQGYPPGSPEWLLDCPSLSSTIHGIAALVAFLAIPAACLVLARRFATESGASF